MRDGLGGIHTINESLLGSSPITPSLFLIGTLLDIRADSLLQMIEFFAALILNTDEAADL